MNIRETIKEAIDAAREQGFNLVQNSWGKDYSECKDCCAMGAVLVANNKNIDINATENNELVSTLIGKSVEWVECFIDGFDEQPFALDVKTDKYDTADCHEAYELGKEFALTYFRC